MKDKERAGGVTFEGGTREEDRSVRQPRDVPKMIPRDKDLQEKLSERYMDFVNLAMDRGLEPPAVVELEVDAPGKNLFVSVTPHPDDVDSTIRRLAETANNVKSTWGRGSRAKITARRKRTSRREEHTARRKW